MTDNIELKIKEIEGRMRHPDFWTDKETAQALVRELNVLKRSREGGGSYDSGGSIVTIFAGAGGDDAEDFARMLYDMYARFIERRGWGARVLHRNENDHNGYRNITFEVAGKNAYGTLKGESGVHRLVRVSPFSARKLRHTSFAMVEAVPKFERAKDLDIPDDEIRVEFSRAGGPGGQNVNKRETAVRIVHAPTGIAVHCESERSQAQNKEKALEILRGKLYRFREEERAAHEKSFYVSKTTDAEWGNQIRSYVLHPYKMVKDHRTGVESKNPDDVLGGNLDEFIEAESRLNA